MLNRILKELRKFNDFKTIQRVKSFVIFGLSVEKKGELFKSIDKEFSLIYKKINSQRNDELSEMLKEISWISNKYSDLLNRYENKEVVGDILEWENDAYTTSYNQIIDRKTTLKELVDKFHFEDVNLIEFEQNEVVFNKMNEEMDFSNLLRYNHDKGFAKYYKLTDKEKQYMDLKKYLIKKRHPQYIFCYNAKYNSDFDTLFKNRFKWDWLKWSIFAFEISQHDFDSQASDFVRQEIYYNREVI